MTFNATDYNAAIKTVDASAATHDIKINGNAKANQILGDSGADVFLYASGDGNDLSALVSLPSANTLQTLTYSGKK